MAEQRKVPPKVKELEDRFAENLEALRYRKNISRRELAERTGITQRVIEKIETGATCRNHRRPVSIGEAIVLALALGVQPAELLKPQQVDHG